ncbi:MAG: nucleotidyltransferase domain-containing protein [Nocardioidaceae bacterium]
MGRGSEEGIRKALRRLTKQGIVVSGRVGSAYSYRLNRDHLAAKYVISLAALKDELLEELDKLLAAWSIPPVYAAVFGSFGRADMTAASDIDIVLVSEDAIDEGVWESQLDALVQTVTAWTGNEARPLGYTVSELVAAHDEPILADVLRDGITVHGQRSWLLRQLRQKAG